MGIRSLQREHKIYYWPKGRGRKGSLIQSLLRQNLGARPTAASWGSPINVDNSPVVLPCWKKLCSPQPESHSLSFSISFLETQFIGNAARSPQGKQKPGSKMKHLINRQNHSTVARVLSARLLAPWRKELEEADPRNTGHLVLCTPVAEGSIG